MPKNKKERKLEMKQRKRKIKKAFKGKGTVSWTEVEEVIND